MIKEDKIENFKSRDLINVECDYCDNKCKGLRKKEESKKKILEKGSKKCSNCKKEKKLRDKYFNILSNSPCVDCSETNPIVLEFDHNNGVDKIKGLDTW